jgi:transposase
MSGGLTSDERRANARIRRRVIFQLKRGIAPGVIAETLGVDRSSVYRWKKAYDDGGLSALESKTSEGRRPKLSITDATKLRALILGSDPRQLQFEFALWTREMVGVLIERQFGVVLSKSSVGRLLRSLGLSPQRPIWRAYQADPDAIERWKTEEYPKIKRAAKRAGGLVFFADEAGIRADYHGGTTWGEVGVTPIVKTTGARYSVNMLSAVSAQGHLHFMLAEGTVNAAVFIEYCKRLMHDYPQHPIFLIVDGHPTHRAKATTEWVKSTGGRLQLFFLPAYSPQLNPDEWVWKNVKHDRIGKAGITSVEDLREKAVRALQRLVDLPSLVIKFFHDPDLLYILR